MKNITVFRSHKPEFEHSALECAVLTAYALSAQAGPKGQLSMCAQK